MLRRHLSVRLPWAANSRRRATGWASHGGGAAARAGAGARAPDRRRVHPANPDEPIAALEAALRAVIAAEPIGSQDPRRRANAGTIAGRFADDLADAGARQGRDHAGGKEALERANELRRKVIMVDDFPKDLGKSEIFQTTQAVTFEALRGRPRGRAGEPDHEPVPRRERQRPVFRGGERRDDHAQPPAGDECARCTHDHAAAGGVRACRATTRWCARSCCAATDRHFSPAATSRSSMPICPRMPALVREGSPANCTMRSWRCGARPSRCWRACTARWPAPASA